MKKPLYLLVILSVLLSGCATRDYVHEYVQNQLNPLNSRADALDSRLKSTETGLVAGASKQGQMEAAIAEVQVTLKVHADRLAETRLISRNCPRPRSKRWSGRARRVNLRPAS